MICKSKFKNHTEFIIPQFIKNNKLFTTNSLKEVKIRNIVNYRFLIVVYQPKTIKQIWWIYINSEKEESFHTAYEDPKNGFTIVEYLLPEVYNFIIDTIMSNGYDILSKRQLVEFIKFWKEYSEFLIQ